MTLVGLTLQAVVIGALVTLALAYETPLRRALQAPDETVALRTRLDTLDRDLSAVAADLSALRAAVAPAADTPALAARVDELATTVQRIDQKLDDVRDATLFPAGDEDLRPPPPSR